MLKVIPNINLDSNHKLLKDEEKCEEFKEKLKTKLPKHEMGSTEEEWKIFMQVSGEVCGRRNPPW